MRSVAILFTVVMLTCKAIAGTLLLSQPADQKSIAEALSRAARDQLRDAIAFDQQSFRLSEDEAPVGTLVAGRGLAKNEDGRSNAVCFLALVRADGSIDLLRTVGSGDWEAESCITVKAVGLVTDATAFAHPRIAIVYQAASPNTATSEPVVLSWDEKAHRIEIDTAGSKQASLAGAITLKAIRRVLHAAR
jgi:hypothetical protein